eukprot:5682914-Prymnesium_polylepis.2
MSVLYCRNFCAGGSVAAQPSWESSPEVSRPPPASSSSATSSSPSPVSASAVVPTPRAASHGGWSASHAARRSSPAASIARLRAPCDAFLRTGFSARNCSQYGRAVIPPRSISPA